MMMIFCWKFRQPSPKDDLRGRARTPSSTATKGKYVGEGGIETTEPATMAKCTIQTTLTKGRSHIFPIQSTIGI